MKHSRKLVVVCTIIFCLLFSVTSAFAETSYTTLKFGSKGSAVTKLQKELKAKGILKSTTDGIYGKKTERAVIEFQIASYIRIDGIAGKQTQAFLFAKPVSRGSTISRKADPSHVYWLSRIIHSEAEGEPYEGKVAVGNVVLNRVNSKDFPNTIYNVIFEYYKGIPQFSPVEEGTIYNTPSKESIKAAEDALKGVRPVGTSTYFFNPDKAKGKWIVENKTYFKRIGNHTFYK